MDWPRLLMIAALFAMPGLIQLASVLITIHMDKRKRP